MADTSIKFKRNGNSAESQWLDPEDEHLMVWYQMESFNTFVKLWGSIDQNLGAGTYTVVVSNQWDVSQFSGEKALFITTVGFFGGSDPFMGIVFLVMSLIVTFLLIAIIVLEFTRGSSSKHYSLENLKW